MCRVLLLLPTEKCWEEQGGAEAARQVRAGTKAWMAIAHPGRADSGWWPCIGKHSRHPRTHSRGISRPALAGEGSI